MDLAKENDQGSAFPHSISYILAHTLGGNYSYLDHITRHIYLVLLAHIS